MTGHRGRAGQGDGDAVAVSALDELTVECESYAAVHELTVVAWRNGLTVEALLALADAVDPIPSHDQ